MPNGRIWSYYDKAKIFAFFSRDLRWHSAAHSLTPPYISAASVKRTKGANLPDDP